MESKWVYKENANSIANLNFNNAINNFVFCSENKELLRVTRDGKIIFNKTDFPDFLEDDFAKEFFNILEKQVIQRCRC